MDLQQRVDQMVRQNRARPVDWDITIAELTQSGRPMLRGRRSNCVYLARANRRALNWASESVARCEARQ